MKGKLKYLVLLFMVMLCAVLATLTYLSITNEEKGKVNYNDKYYNIIFGDVFTYDETTMSVKVNHDNHEIVVKIPNIVEFNEEKAFEVNLTNIGNIDSKVNKLSVMNVMSDLNIEDVSYDISLKEGGIIKAGDNSVITIKIKNNNTKVSGGYFNFVVKYKFNEVVL